MREHKYYFWDTKTEDSHTWSGDHVYRSVENEGKNRDGTFLTVYC